MDYPENIDALRKTEYPVEPFFTRRWSPRSMDGKALAREELMRLFEAAHWAPSGGNGQPWRFFYALHGESHWAAFLDLLVPANREWCEKAGALVIIVSKTTSDRSGKPVRTYAYDTGAAWMGLALQGSQQNLVVHGMGGFDYDKARQLLRLGPELEVQAMAAIGHPAAAENLPEGLREKEKPSLRRPLSEVVFEGPLPG